MLLSFLLEAMTRITNGLTDHIMGITTLGEMKYREKLKSEEVNS